MLRTRGVRIERVGADAPSWTTRCAARRASPCRTWPPCVARAAGASEKLEVQKAIARARAEGKSVAGAAFAVLGGGAESPARGAGGPSQRYRARRGRARFVFCLRHGMEGCAHARRAACWR